MSTFILILYLASYHTGVGMVAPEFNNLAACELAGKQIVARINGSDYICVSKGENK